MKSPKDKIVVEKTEEVELPQGWKQEVKIRKKGSVTKLDRYYTDPVTGYIFRSLRDVQRYLKTGELGRLAIKPKGNDGGGVDNASDPCKKDVEEEKTEEKSESNEQMSETWRHKRPLENVSGGYKTRSKLSETGKSESPHRVSKRLAGIDIDTPPPSPSPLVPKTRHATQRAGIKIDTTPSSPPDTKTSRNATTPSPSPSPSPLEPKTRRATRQAGIKIESPPPSPPDSKTRQAKRVVGIETVASPTSSPPEHKSRQAKRVAATETDASPPEPKTRRTTRQSGVKIESPPPSPPDTRTSRQATKRAKVAETDNKQKSPILPPPVNQENQENVKKEDFKTNKSQESKIISPPPPPPVTPATLPPMTHTTTTTYHQPPPPPPPTTVSPPPGFEKQKSPILNPIDTKPPEPSINFSLSDFWTDPCIEFAVKTLTGAIPFGDLNKADTFTSPSPSVPMDSLWTDPCIEFAVKTLTGAIPVGKNDYSSQQQPGNSSSSNPRALHDFSLPDVGMNLCQTDVLSKHYETGQQDSGVLTVGNGGLQKAGNMVVAQQVNGSIGQCSRSRLFQ